MPTTGWIAGGLLVQHLARREIGGARLDVERTETEALHPDWQHVLALADTTSVAELTDPALAPETLLWRLFHEEEVRISEGALPTRGCRCNAGAYQGRARTLSRGRTCRHARR